MLTVFLYLRWCIIAEISDAAHATSRLRRLKGSSGQSTMPQVAGFSDPHAVDISHRLWPRRVTFSGDGSKGTPKIGRHQTEEGLEGSTATLPPMYETAWEEDSIDGIMAINPAQRKVNVGRGTYTQLSRINENAESRWRGEVSGVGDGPDEDVDTETEKLDRTGDFQPPPRGSTRADGRGGGTDYLKDLHKGIDRLLDDIGEVIAGDSVHVLLPSSQELDVVRLRESSCQLLQARCLHELPNRHKFISSGDPTKKIGTVGSCCERLSCADVYPKCVRKLGLSKFAMREVGNPKARIGTDDSCCVLTVGVTDVMDKSQIEGVCEDVFPSGFLYDESGDPNVELGTRDSFCHAYSCEDRRKQCPELFDPTLRYNPYGRPDAPIGVSGSCCEVRESFTYSTLPVYSRKRRSDEELDNIARNMALGTGL